jgi:hypothetical protein
MIRSSSIAIAAAFGVGGLVGALVTSVRLADRGDVLTTTPRPVWTELQWTFPMDEWGTGKVFQCKAADCGTEVNIYLRAKIGFCNCTSGVADDEELERLSDFDLTGGPIAALGDGRPITVAWMKGRSRSYEISGSARGGKSALLAAFNDGCDAIVTSAVLDHHTLAEIEPHVIEFLNGKIVLQWAKVTLGL